MKILVIGPRLHSEHAVTGLQTFNTFLARTLQDIGHELHYAIAQPDVSPMARMQTHALIGCHVFQFPRSGWSKLFKGYDQIVLSASVLDYAGILHAAYEIPVIIWTHGQHVCPLQRLDAGDIRGRNATLVAINDGHMEAAEARGLAGQTVKIDMPAMFAQRHVQPAEGYCVAVGTIEPRKNYKRVAEFADAIGMPCRVYGGGDPRKLPDNLEYRGRVPHHQIPREIAGADFIIHAAEVEGDPNALREARQLGLPILCVDAPYAREVLNPKYTIFLAPGELPKHEDLDCLRSLEVRQAIADDFNAKYSRSAFRETLAGLLAI
ncbi:MAG: glycosyltransferase [Oscillospiraceae bacterium]|nr:glycosyltransferase [Oscillospiraceae bacterium]